MSNEISVKEACIRYGLSKYSILKLIKENKIPSAVKNKSSLVFSEEELVKAAGLNYISMEEAATTLGMPTRQVYYLVRNKEIIGMKGTAGKTLISREDLNRYKILLKRLETMLTNADMAKRLGTSVRYINQLIVKNKIVPDIKHQKKWYTTEEEYERYQSTILDRDRYLTIEETGSRLSSTSNQIKSLIKNGSLEHVIYKTLYYIPIESIEDYENFRILTRPQDIFLYKYKKMAIPIYLQKSFFMFEEYAIINFNSRKQSYEKMKVFIFKYLKIAELFLLPLTKELIHHTDKEVELILKNKLLLSSDIEVIAHFLTYCQGSENCLFKNTYTIVKTKTSEQEIYSPKEFYSFYLYVKDDIEQHIQAAIEKRKYCVTWVYIIMHLIDAWRHTDILTKLPHIPIEVIGMHSFDDFSPLSEEQAQILINHVFNRIEKMTISKTGALGHFLVHGDMIVPTATALAIAEMHRRKNNDNTLLRLYDTSNGTKVDRDMHLRLFFGEREDLLSFKSRKMNKSLLTYFFYSVVEGKKHSDIAYELSQRLRGHTEIDSTKTYIESTNNDGSINRVSLNLVNRGHFGWLYNFIIQTYLDPTNNQSLEERTQSIVALKGDFTPIQLENISNFMVKRQQEKESLALRIANLPMEELERLLYKISRGEMPAKMPHSQCVIHPQCSQPKAASCLSCENIIPKNYLLFSIKEEIWKLVSSIRNTKYNGVIVRDYNILILVLELLKQAVQQFGKEYVGTFIDLRQLKRELFTVDERFKAMGELKSDK